MLISVCCAAFNLLLGTTAQRMLQERERIVWQTEHAGDGSCGNLKRCCAQYHCGLAKLFVDDAVMQTAR